MTVLHAHHLTEIYFRFTCVALMTVAGKQQEEDIMM